MGRRLKWDNDAVARLRQYAADGYSHAEIGKIIGVSRQRINQICARHNIAPSRPYRKKWSLEMFEALRIQLESGRTITDICSEYGLCRSTVSRMCGLLGFHGVRRRDDPRLLPMLTIFIPGRKTCTACGRYKPLSEFSTYRGRYNSHCKACKASTSRERKYYLRHTVLQSNIE